MLTMWHPYNDWGFGNLRRTLSTMETLRREMGSLLGESAAAQRSDGQWDDWPSTSLDDKGDALVVKADVPGISEKEIEITVTGDTVTIRGKRDADVPKGYSVHRKERSSFTFARSYRLPAKVDSDKAQASVKNGILEMVLPKAAESQPRKITVKTN